VLLHCLPLLFLFTFPPFSFPPPFIFPFLSFSYFFSSLVLTPFFLSSLLPCFSFSQIAPPPLFEDKIIFFPLFNLYVCVCVCVFTLHLYQNSSPHSPSSHNAPPPLHSFFSEKGSWSAPSVPTQPGLSSHYSVRHISYRGQTRGTGSRDRQHSKGQYLL